MKLLIYSHYFAPSVGGVENIVQSLADGLSRRRKANGEPEFEVTLVTETAAGDFNDGALPFRVVREPGVVALWRLIRLSDVMHLAGPALTPLFLAWLAGKPYAIEHHGYQAICLNGLLLQRPGNAVCAGHFQAGRYLECWRCEKHESGGLRSLLRLLLMFPRSWLSSRANMNLAITKHVLERHALSRSAVIYYGIEEHRPNAECSYPAGQVIEKICFAYVGRLVPEKGIPILLEAARILRKDGRSFEVLIIGDGPERSRLEEIVARDQLEDCVRLTGMITGTALANALRDVQVVVMPSIWEETAGLAAIEQMFRGRMVIASDIGGLGEVLGDAGLKCKPGDATDLAKRMEQVLQSPSLVDSFGGNARERGLRLFTRERMIQEHARAYHQVCRRANGRSLRSP